MALYENDYRLHDAIEHVNKLGKTAEGILVLYYVNNLKVQIKDLQMKNKEYEEFFVRLNQLLPKDNILF